MVARFHACPQSLEHFNVKDHRGTGPAVVIGSGFRRSGGLLAAGRNGFCLKPCRSFRGEDNGGDAEEGEAESARKRGNLKKGGGILKSLKSSVWGGFGWGFRDGDEHRKAVAKLEEICQSVSNVFTGFCFRLIIFELNNCVLFSWSMCLFIGCLVAEKIQAKKSLTAILIDCTWILKSIKKSIQSPLNLEV